MLAKLNIQQPLLQASVSHDPSEILETVFVEIIFFQDSKNSKEEHLFKIYVFFCFF